MEEYSGLSFDSQLVNVVLIVLCYCFSNHQFSGELLLIF